MGNNLNRVVRGQLFSFQQHDGLQIKLNKAEMIDYCGVSWGKQFAGKNKRECCFVGWEKCGCEVRNTYTWVAEAGEANEMK